MLLAQKEGLDLSTYVRSLIYQAHEEDEAGVDRCDLYDALENMLESRAS